MEICYLSLQVMVSLAELVQVSRGRWAAGTGTAMRKLFCCWSRFAVTWSCPKLECDWDTVVVYEIPVTAHNSPAASVKRVYNGNSLMGLDVQMDFSLKNWFSGRNIELGFTPEALDTQCLGVYEMSCTMWRPASNWVMATAANIRQPN